MSRPFDKGLLGDIIRVFLLVAFFSAMALLLGRQHLRELLFDMATIRTELQGGRGISGYVFSGLIFTLAGGGITLLGVPRLLVSAVGGMIYGAFLGSILSILASLLGASGLYLAGKSILAAVVERRLGDKAKTWKDRFQENAFWWVLHGTLFPFSNFTVMSLTCGSCKVPFIPFILGSLLGYIPLAVVFAAYGSGGAKGNLWQVGLATLLLVFSIFLRRFLKRWFPANKGSVDTSSGAS